MSFKYSIHPFNPQLSPRAAQSPQNANTSKLISINDSTNSHQQQSQEKSLKSKLQKLTLDNHKLLEQTTNLTKQLNKAHLDTQSAQEKLSILLQENQKLSDLLQSAKNTEKAFTSQQPIEPKSSLQKANKKIKDLVQSNNKLTLLLEERLAHMQSMNTMITDQHSHHSQQYDLERQQHAEVTQFLRSENTSLNEMVTLLNKKHQTDNSDRNALLAQVASCHNKDRQQMQTIIKLQDQATALTQEVQVYTVELECLQSWVDQMTHNETQLMDEQDKFKQMLAESELQLSMAQYEIESMKIILSSQDDAMLVLSTQVAEVHCNSINDAAQTDVVVQQQFKMSSTEIAHLKQQNEELHKCYLQVLEQKEQFQIQVQIQQQQIAQQNQRLSHGGDKEQTLIQQHDILKSKQLTMRDPNIQTESPFRSLKLHNLYTQL